MLMGQFVSISHHIGPASTTLVFALSGETLYGKESLTAFAVAREYTHTHTHTHTHTPKNVQPKRA